MEKLNLKLSRTTEPSLFHDSRADSRVLMKVVNALHDKINELIDENEKQNREIEELWKYVNPE